MKLLINICGHDGIESIYAGVGTIVKRYIKSTQIVLNKRKVDYDINLFTPKYNKNSFGYDEKIKKYHQSLENVNLYEIENGSNGNINYGTIDNWSKLCKNTAKIINEIDINCYDQIITIANDTPFAGLLKKLKSSIKHKKVWIPHSTVKIHEVDSAVEDKGNAYNERLLWEEDCINFINEDYNSYLGSTGRYIEKHLFDEYNLKKSKSIFIPNGEIIEEERIYDESIECKKLFNDLKDKTGLIISFGRAEEYKNLDCAVYLGDLLDLTSVIITKPYYKDQPILKKYESLKNNHDFYLYYDVPFEFPHYIINHFNKPMIVLIPSKKEIVGLIINEIRKMNKSNVLIVANDIGGLSEQINDGEDGVLVNLENISESAHKIKKYFNEKDIKRINDNSQKTLNTKYNFQKNMDIFYSKLIDKE